MLNFNDETLAKAKNVGNAEELMNLAKESELADEEIGNVSGGIVNSVDTQNPLNAFQPVDGIF